jgi:hypothetical protein
MTRQRQRGVSILGWLAILLLLGSVAMLVVRLGPHYIDFETIVSIVNALPANEVHTMDKATIRESLLKRFLINNIRDLNVNKVVDIDRRRETTVLTVHYERREHLLYNVDLVLTFYRQFEFQ